MANWYYNVFSVSGERDELNKFKRKAIGPSDFRSDPEPMSVFSFTNLMPVPQDAMSDHVKRNKWIISIRPLLPQHQLVARIAWVVLGFCFGNQFWQRDLFKHVHAQNL